MGYEVSFFLGPADGLDALVTPAAVAASLDWHYRHLCEGRDLTTDDAEIDLLLRAADEGAAAARDAAERATLDRLVTLGCELDARLVGFARRAIRDGVPLRAGSAEEAFLIDRLTDLVFWPFGCVAPDAPVKLTSLRHGWGGLRSCYEAERLIAERCDPTADALWRHLMVGRGVGRAGGEYPYVPAEPYCPIGYWTYDEAVTLVAALAGRFVYEEFTVGPGPDYNAIHSAEGALADAIARGAGVITWMQ